jgi:hypothetical protein
MITEDYVSYNTAKLLKEKGFDEACRAYYYEDDGKLKLMESYSAYAVKNMSNSYFFVNGAPTLQMAMKWLREAHNIDMWVECHNSNKRYKGYIHSEQRGDEALFYEDSYEQACEAAIKYCLENLI